MTLVAAAVRRFPRLPGRWRLIATVLPWLRRYGHAFGRYVVPLPRDQVLFEADLADWLGQFVFLTGQYEPGNEQLLRACVSEAQTVLDVGANAGYFSVLMGALVGAAGRVHAFEPVPALQEVIRRQMVLNPALNITLHGWAASDDDTSATISVGPAGHLGLSSLRTLGKESGKVLVQCRPIDQVLAQLPTVAFVKIDVEGAELKALRGMRGLLERDRPLLLMEATDSYLRDLGDSLAGLVAWLRALRYRLYRVEEASGRGVRLHELDDGDSPPAQFDLLAVPESRQPAALTVLLDSA